MPAGIDQLVEQAAEAQKQRRFSEAKRCWENAVDLLRQQSDALALARALRSLGETERKLHDAAAARLHYEQAVTLYRALSDPLAFAHTVRHLGDVYLDLRLPELAQRCHLEALEVYRAHPEAAPLDVANAVRSMALVKSERGATQDALELWKEAKRLYATTGVESGVAECSRWLARLNDQAAGR